MEKQLPKNWIETDLETIIERMSNGSGLQQFEEPFENSFPISRIETIWNETIDLERVKYVSPTKADIEKYSFLPGDVLFSHINSDKHLGKTAVFNLDTVLIHGINLLLLRAKPQFNGYLLNYFLRYYRLTGKFIEVAQRSVNQSSINQKKLSTFKTPLPPLAEQNRIVAKLDTLFTQLETIKTSMANIPLLLKDFRQQVLTQAVTGKLTEEWRKGRELVNDYNDRIININKRKSNINLPKNWLDLSFDSVVNIKSNLVPPNDYLEFPLITPDVIQSETGILLSKPLVSDIMPISAKHYFSKGDIVYSKIRPYLSKLIITDFDGLCSADMYPLSTDLNIKFLFYFMLSSEFLIHATTAGERSVLPKINQKGLNIIPIPTPSLKEQQEIVSRVESLFVKADAIEQQYKSLKDKIDNLPQALLHKAFKGELTEQLESDGDARELLRQIQELKMQTAKVEKKKVATKAI